MCMVRPILRRNAGLLFSTLTIRNLRYTCRQWKQR
jgi:hypothetical protein